MKWLFSIAFVIATSMPSLADELPDEPKRSVFCGLNLTDEQLVQCIVRELNRRVRVAEECQSRKLPEPELRACINRGLEGAGL